MASRRGFLGALFGGAAATAGGLLIPKAVAAKEKIEVTAPSDVMDALMNAEDGEITVCNSSMIPDEFFENRVNLYQEWWRQASNPMWTMPDDKFRRFIGAHLKVNEEFGINVTLKGNPWLETDVGVDPCFPNIKDTDEYF